jgi:hypothetical protein
MSTVQQIEANRLNAQHSSGPRTAEGKAVSRMNALKSGIDARSLIIPGENAAELQALADGMTAEHAPSTATERALVDSIVYSTWLLNRLRKTETQLTQMAIAEAGGNPAFALAAAFRNKDLARVHRHINTHRRAIHESLAELRRLRAAREAEEEAVPEPLEPSHPENGFVPQTVEMPADPPAPQVS